MRSPTRSGLLALAACLAWGGCGNGNDIGGPPECERRILEGDVTNARDLGAQPLSSDRYVACRKILRGGDLTGLSSAACDEFALLEIETIIDLRMTSVQQNQPAVACVTGQAVAIPAAMPKLLPDTPDNYLALMDETDAIATVFETLGNATAYPLYIHCVIGRDRASFVSALVLLALGASRQTVLDEFDLSEDAGVSVKPECIEAVLDEIDTRGGIQAFLTSTGVTSAHLEVLRAEVQID